MNEPEFEPLRIALLGCGGMGIRHALAVAEMHVRDARPVSIVALCDANVERANDLADRLHMACGVRPLVSTKPAVIFASTEVEAVDIVLPTWLHHTMILDALSAGKHVLVEKPLALTVAACDLVVAAAEKAGKVVAVAENYRRIASNRAFGALVQSGRLGRLDAMFVRNIGSPTPEMAVGDRLILPPAWYQDRRRAGGYHLLEMGVHEADLQNFWFGEIKTVQASTRQFGRSEVRGAGASEDMLSATFEFANGFVSHLTFCSTMPRVDITDRMVVGERSLSQSGSWHAWQDGEIVQAGEAPVAIENVVQDYLDNLDVTERAHHFPHGTWKSEQLKSETTVPLSYGVGMAIYDFARAVRKGGVPEITARKGRLAVATCHAMMESAYLGRAVDIADVLNGSVFEAQLPLNRAIDLA